VEGSRRGLSPAVRRPRRTHPPQKLERERFILPCVELKDDDSGQMLDRFLADFSRLYEHRAAANIGELINSLLLFWTPPLKKPNR
jgi:hypothetical protein